MICEQVNLNSVLTDEIYKYNTSLIAICDHFKISKYSCLTLKKKNHGNSKSD